MVGEDLLVSSVGSMLEFAWPTEEVIVLEQSFLCFRNIKLIRVETFMWTRG
jgi:hypothetical protein